MMLLHLNIILRYLVEMAGWRSDEFPPRVLGRTRPCAAVSETLPAPASAIASTSALILSSSHRDTATLAPHPYRSAPLRRAPVHRHRRQLDHRTCAPRRHAGSISSIEAHGERWYYSRMPSRSIRDTNDRRSQGGQVEDKCYLDVVRGAFNTNEGAL